MTATTFSASFGSVAGSTVAAILFGALAVAFGVMVPALMRRAAAPAGEPAVYGTSPLARGIAGVSVTALLLLVFWLWLWSGFYSLGVDRDGVTLTWLVPTRHATLRREDIQHVEWVPGTRFTRRLALTLTDGRTFHSTNTSMPDDAARQVVRELDAWLGHR